MGRDAALASRRFQQALDVLERLEKAGQLPPSEKDWIEIVQEAIAECQKEIEQPKK